MTPRLQAAAWRWVPALPGGLARWLFSLAADLAWWRRGPGVLQLEANLARARPRADDAELRELSRAGMRSYLRYWCELFSLHTWSPERIDADVRFEGAAPLLAALADGRGAVVFMGHLGNWDHLGAWAATHLAPVTTVAERLEPESTFQEFVRQRARLSITALPLTGGGSFTHLVRTLRAGGLVALLGDRDLTGTGAVVDLLGHRARVAVGPAALAVTTGAPLFVITCHSEPGAGLRSRHRPWTVVGRVTQVAVPDRDDVGTRARQVAVATQRCADVLGETIREHPEDWHVLQPVFEDEAPEDGAPEEGAPEEGAPEDGAPEDGAPEDGAPRDEVVHDGTAHDGTAPDGTVERGTIRDAAGGDGDALDGATGAGAPGAGPAGDAPAAGEGTAR